MSNTAATRPKLIPYVEVPLPPYNIKRKGAPTPAETSSTKRAKTNSPVKSLRTATSLSPSPSPSPAPAPRHRTGSSLASSANLVPPSLHTTPSSESQFPGVYVETDKRVSDMLFETKGSIEDDSDASESEGTANSIDDDSSNGASSEEKDEEDDNYPMRCLTNFHIRDEVSGISIPFESLLGLSFSSCYVNGFAKATKGSHYKPLKKGGVQIRTGRILEVNIYDVNDLGQVDSRVYIRTECAWYILDNPAASYNKHWSPFFRRHEFLLALVTAALDDRSLTKENFLEDIAPKYNENDFEDAETQLYIKANLSDICSNYKDATNRNLSRVPVIKLLSDREDSVVTPSKLSKHSKHHRTGRGRTTSKNAKSKGADIKVTPIVASISSAVFDRGATVAGIDNAKHLRRFLESIEETTRAFEHHPDTIHLKDAIGQHHHRTYYRRTGIREGTHRMHFKIGDVVMVQPDIASQTKYYTHAQLAVSSPNKWANTMWFGLIRAIYKTSKPNDENHSNKWAHVQWLEPAHRTLTGELGNSQELHLIPECDDILLGSIVQPVDFYRIEAGMVMPGDAKSEDSTQFFCATMFIREGLYYPRLYTLAEEEEVLQYISEDEREYTPCVSCAIKAKNTKTCTPRIEEASHNAARLALYLHGYEVHANDFVFLKPRNGSNVLRKAKILSIKDHLISMELYEQHTRHTFLLIPTNEVVELKKEKIHGQILSPPIPVKHRREADASWTSLGKYHFLVQDKDRLCGACATCLQEREELQKELFDAHGPLRGVDAFSGGGLLSVGFEQGAHFETEVAIDFNRPAARTFKRNHQDAVVINDDIGKVLDAMVACRSGDLVEADRYLSRVNVVNRSGLVESDVQKLRHADLLMGGPPCQAFSVLNHTPKEIRVDDPRAKLPLTMMSMAELERFPLVILENVKGLLTFELKTPELTVKHGMLKLIAAVFLALGYQVRPMLLQAGCYGSPQTRTRVIFAAALLTEELIEPPLPTHTFMPRSFRADIAGNKLMLPSWNCPSSEEWHCWAPFHGVSVNDAIGDLAPFDWKNPHEVVPQTKEQLRDVKTRVSQGIVQVDAVTNWAADVCEFPTSGMYAKEPENQYQREMRKRMGNEARVAHHCTRKFRTNILERMVSVPLLPGASHFDIDHRLWGTNITLTSGKHKFYGRIDGNHVFDTAITRMTPIKNMKVMHPTQRRMVTCREMARAQGLPDNYEFVTVPADEYRQEQDGCSHYLEQIHRIIGNGVPTQMARAIASQVQAASFRKLVAQQLTRQRDGSMEA